jgi:hypothetical protein
MEHAAAGMVAVALLFHHMPCETATPPLLYMAGAACISWCVPVLSLYLSQPLSLHRYAMGISVF